MTIRVAVHRTCDRCAHPFDESSVKYGDALPVFEKKRLRCAVYTDANEQPLFDFNDLCPDCDRVVEGYIKKIRLDSEEGSPKKNKKSKAEKSEPKPEEKAEAPAPA